MSGIKIIAILGVIALLTVSAIYGLKNTYENRSTDTNEDLQRVTEDEVIMQFGFPKDSFHFLDGEIKPNQFLSNILSDHGVRYEYIDELARAAEPIFSVRKLRSGKPFTLVSRDSCTTPTCFIYEPNAYTYVKYHIGEDPCIELIERPVDTVLSFATGTIEGSLWQTMQSNGINPALISKMEDALAWSVSFYHVQKGDRFKLIYEKLQVEGEETGGVGRLLGAYFGTSSKDYYAVRFKSPKYDGYFDLEGRPMKKSFLRAPVRYSRISSSYNPRRFHPIKKRVVPHLGTDYAAPHGEPILAVADGIITKASYTSGNGNYVKIRHDKTYETQYLHMSRFKSGIAPGVRVRQGDVIGYVGSTGLATGPHVCFRFWKNGRQVNHLRENFPEPDPLPEDILPEYLAHSKEVKKILDKMKIDPDFVKAGL